MTPPSGSGPFRVACAAVIAVSLVACADHKGSFAAPVDAGPPPVATPAPNGCPDISKCEELCRQGGARGCLNAADTYSFGRGVPQDEHHAAELFERSCSLGSGTGCTLAGRMYEFAHGVPKDVAQALSFYEKGCHLDDMGGCYNVGVVLERGDGVAQDEQRALTMYKTVCAQGSDIACAAANRLQDRLKAPPPIPPNSY